MDPWAWMTYGLFLIVASWFDLREMRIPNELVGATVALWGLLMLLQGVLLDGTLVGLGSGIFSGVIIAGCAIVSAHFYEQFRGMNALGGGDIKLLFVVGLFCGLDFGIFVVLIACLSAVTLAFALPRFGWKHPLAEAQGTVAHLQTVPFAPAVLMGSVGALLIGALYAGVF